MIIPTTHGSKVRFISLEPSTKPLPACLEGDRSFVDGSSGGMAAVFTNPVDGLPVVCNGRNASGADTCVKYYPATDEWETVGSPIYSGAVKQNMFDFDKDVGFVLAGGGSNRDRVERSLDYAVSFEELEPMPEGRRGGCLTIVDDNTVYVGGGTANNNRPARSAYTLNIETNQWTARTNIPHDYRWFDCNKVELPNGEKEVYFVGGFPWGGNAREVQIFNLASDQWRKAKHDFPMGMNQNPTIRYQDSFINAGGDTDRIWKLNVTDESWIRLEGTLGSPYFHHTITLVGDLC